MFIFFASAWSTPTSADRECEKEHKGGEEKMKGETKTLHVIVPSSQTKTLNWLWRMYIERSGPLNSARWVPDGTWVKLDCKIWMIQTWIHSTALRRSGLEKIPSPGEDGHEEGITSGKAVYWFV